MKHFLLSLALFVCFGLHAQSNQYILFDGSDDYAVLDSASKYVANKPMSMTGWFYSEKLAYGSGMMGFRGYGSGTGVFYVLQLNQGKLECRIGTTAGTYDAPNDTFTIKANIWQHIAAVFDGSTIKLYVNGTLIGSKATTGAFTTKDRPFAIGKSLAPGYNFIYDGRADEVTLWSKALTQAEIQSMMTSELTGTEPNLELYYKCDQGYPFGDNTSIKKLINKVGNGERDATLTNMAMNGDSSNFGGTLKSKVQAISFPQITTKTTQSEPFTLNAKATSNLNVTYTIVSGPATISGNKVTLNGTGGTVVVKAEQAGNASFDPAPSITSTFEVIDPSNNTPKIDIRNPLDGDFYSTTLGPLELAARIDIDYPDLFKVSKVEFYVDNVKAGVKDWLNNHYTNWWTPKSAGSHTFTVKAYNNFNKVTEKSVTFNIKPTTTNQTVKAFNKVWVYNQVVSQEVEAVLPCYTGDYDSIGAELVITCPTGGCDPWDRVSHIEVQGHNGEWYEIIRFITSYGKACSHNVDLTDFMSLLQGKARFRVTLSTSGNGFEYTLNLTYRAGKAQYPYSQVDKLWNKTYQFGDFGNLQPCENISFKFKPNTKDALIKLVSSGHGWGGSGRMDNTGNAAEFHRDTHYIEVNGAVKFSQDNWLKCNPNPNGCNDQFGTWIYDRAGWCPGAIAPWFNFNVKQFIDTSKNVTYHYKLNPNYVDSCHPNFPTCVNTSICKCSEGFNPHLIVSSYMISKSGIPYNKVDTVADTTSRPPVAIVSAFNSGITVGPNPSFGKFYVDVPQSIKSYSIIVVDNEGRIVFQKTDIDSRRYLVNIESVSRGFYILQVYNNDMAVSERIIVDK